VRNALIKYLKMKQKLEKIIKIGIATSIISFATYILYKYYLNAGNQKGKEYKEEDDFDYSKVSG